MTKIQIFIATYNRPHLVLNAVRSALSQDFESFEVIVSDNSTNDETYELIRSENLSGIKYIRRFPPLSGIEHLNLILESVESDYFMIFHDDDVMHKDMIKVLSSILIKSSEVIAVGSNAIMVKNGKALKKHFNKRLKNDVVINTIDEMIGLYSLPAFTPFPSYLYRKEVAMKLRLEIEHGGKHCDVAFVINLLTLGKVVFVAKPLMDYHFHTGQDSAECDYRAFSQLISYIKKIMNYQKTCPVIRRMRIQNVYGETKFNLLNNKLIIGSRRYFKLMSILFKYSTCEYFVKILFISICLQFKSNIIKILN
jgi:glycosyltransferase involved in cell wall biosynthesis